MTSTGDWRHRRTMTAAAIASVLAAGCAIAGITAATASADLPRTYDVQRVDSPMPVQNGRFALSMVNVGDVNRDGEDDVLTGTDKHLSLIHI